MSFVVEGFLRSGGKITRLVDTRLEAEREFHDLKSLCADVQVVGAEGIVAQWSEKVDRREEAEKLIRLLASAGTAWEWNRARAFGQKVGAPDPGAWSKPAGVLRVLQWALERGVWKGMASA